MDSGIDDARSVGSYRSQGVGPVRAPPVCESRNREDDASQSSLARPLHPLAYGLQYHGNITLDVLQFA